MRPDREAEAGLVVAALEPVGAAVLVLGPPDRQRVGARDLLVDDRAITDRGADDRVPPAAQRVE
jgi:hypothetical protein